MIWALVLLGLLALAVASPGFRAVLGCGLVTLVVLGIVLIVAFVGYSRYSDAQVEAERESARRRIALSEIELLDLTLEPSYGTGSYYLVGRIRNHSKMFALSALALQLTMEDCTASGCEIVGQTTESLFLAVPAGQARDLREYVSFAGLGTPRGSHRWRYTVAWIEGR